MWLIFLTILILILISGFFSASETSMMSLNRYRLKHLSGKSRPAKRAMRLLERPDRLLGMILVGNTFANILVSSLTTIVAVHFFGDVGVAVSTVVLTFIILLFAEILPKTFAAIQPERLAFPATAILSVLLILTYPLVWILNVITNTILKFLGVHIHGRHLVDPLTPEELKSVVQASSEKMQDHKHMLLSVLDLEKMTVKDAMIPRQMIYGLNLEDEWTAIYEKICASPFSKLPVYRGDVDAIVGILSVKKLLGFSIEGLDPKQELEKIIAAPYFVPETTSLQKQLINFQKNSEHMALVVDEYGDIQGLVTVEDILEEIVGEFTNLSQPSAHIHTRKLEDGSVIVDASMTLRDLHRDLGLDLPLNRHAKTLSGLLLQQLDAIPGANTCVQVESYPMEILTVDDNSIKSVRIYPKK